MASEKKTCRVCGKEYEPCRTANRNPNVFHWQEVACSPECGATYLQRIVESRKPTVVTKRNKHKRTESKVIPVEVREVPFMAIAEKDVAETVNTPVDVE